MAKRVVANVADASPFEIAMLLIAITRGVTFVTGYLPSSVAERALPHWLLVICLAELASGAALTLAAVLFGRIPRERAGLGLLAPSAAIYAVVLFTRNPHAATLSFVVYGSLSLACVVRVWQLGRIQRAVASAARVLDQ